MVSAFHAAHGYIEKIPDVIDRLTTLADIKPIIIRTVSNHLVRGKLFASPSVKTALGGAQL